MITWKNMDTLNSYQELLNAERVNLAAAMSGENGAERVKNYSVPMGEGLDFNFGARPVDDSILAAGKGMTFRVPTEDLLISRWLDFGGIGVGDLIAVSYTGGIKEGTVQGAYNISPAFLADGNILIPE